MRIVSYAIRRKTMRGREDEKGLVLSIRSLLEERLTGKVTDKDINYCIRWAKRLDLQDV